MKPPLAAQAAAQAAEKAAEKAAERAAAPPASAAAPGLPPTPWPQPLPTLRARMLRRVLLPLALTWLAGSVVALAVAYVYTRKAFDRSLLDDAYAIAANVSQRDGALVFNLSPREVGAVLFDQDERVFFAVQRADGSLLAGQGGLPEQPTDQQRSAALGDATEPVRFGQRHYRGLDLRTVTLRRTQPMPYTVVLAQTTRSRSLLAGQLLAASLLPQAVLLLLLGTWLGRSIGRELKPLQQLEQALEQRDTNDLTPVRLVQQSRDIAHLSDAFNALMARIGAGVRAQREFAGNVAHELRTPLAGIRSLAEYGLQQSDPAAWAAQLRSIVASEARASRMVDQLLALALADEAGQSLQLRAVAVDVLVQDLLLRLLPRADALGVDLGAEGIDQPVWALGSVALLEGLLGNLTDNALRYGHAADAADPADPENAPRVTVAVQAQGSQVLLSVSDNGRGMDAAQRSRVTARWAQGPLGLSQGEGAGLGLAIVARYVELLGGRMALESTPGGAGLRVCVWLLRADGAEPAAVGTAFC